MQCDEENLGNISMGKRKNPYAQKKKKKWLSNGIL